MGMLDEIKGDFMETLMKLGLIVAVIVVLWLFFMIWGWFH